MTKKKSGRGKRMSMFTALPPTLKHALRSQPRLERVVATAVQAQAQPAEQPLPTDRLLPTQPPSEAEYPDAASETSSMDMDSDSDKENVRPATAAASPPSPLPASASVLGSAVVSRRVETVPMEVNADHPWDCTGLVPRYTDASSLPKELRKCEPAPPPTTTRADVQTGGSGTRCFPRTRASRCCWTRRGGSR